jgi:hypothetical protein
LPPRTAPRRPGTPSRMLHGAAAAASEGFTKLVVGHGSAVALNWASSQDRPVAPSFWCEAVGRESCGGLSDPRTGDG